MWVPSRIHSFASSGLGINNLCSLYFFQDKTLVIKCLSSSKLRETEEGTFIGTKIPESPFLTISPFLMMTNIRNQKHFRYAMNHNNNHNTCMMDIQRILSMQKFPLRRNSGSYEFPLKQTTRFRSQINSSFNPGFIIFSPF